MSEQPYTVDEVKCLLTKLEDVAGLDEREQALLNAIVQMFKDVVAVEEDRVPPPAGLLPFDESFLPDKAKLVLDYANRGSVIESASPTLSQITKYITRTRT